MHYEFLTSMVLEREKLILKSERGRVYELDIRTRAVRRMKTQEPSKPAAGNSRLASQLAIRQCWPRGAAPFVHLG